MTFVFSGQGLAWMGAFRFTRVLFFFPDCKQPEASLKIIEGRQKERKKKLCLKPSWPFLLAVSVSDHRGQQLRSVTLAALAVNFVEWRLSPSSTRSTN